MPLYEYECEKCGARFEVIQRFSDSPIEACRVCGGAVHKLISAPAIQFKGTGWYITDYAKKSGTDSSPAPSTTASDTKTASSSSSSSTASTPSTTSPSSTSSTSNSSSTSSGSSGGGTKKD